jgi:hypothetical protein
MTAQRNAKNQAIRGAETQARSSVSQFVVLSAKGTPYPQLAPLSTLPHHIHTPFTMASIIGRAAFRATRPLRSSGINAGSENAASAASREADKNALKQGARKDPELYVRRRCLCVLPDT